MSEITYKLERAGKIRKMKLVQITTRWIGKVFNVFPDSIILVADDGTIEVPDESGSFTGLLSYMPYEVQGDDCVPTAGALEAEGHMREMGESSGLCGSFKAPIHSRKNDVFGKSSIFGKSSKQSQSGYKHKGPSIATKPPGVKAQETLADKGGRKADATEWKKNIDICEYDPAVSGGLKKTGNFPIPLNNESARVDYIAESISQELFEGEEAVLLDSDNLKIRDSTVTRGIINHTTCNAEIIVFHVM